MARPIVTIAGEYNSYSTGEMLKLVFSNNAFSVANKRQLANNTAPYVFSFFNTTTTPSAFRIAQTKYNWGDWGSVGSSIFTFWNPDGTWEMKADGVSLVNPKNPYALVNAEIFNTSANQSEKTSYLLAADYDSGVQNGTVVKSNVTILKMNSDTSYTVAGTWNYPGTPPAGYYAHCQDLIMVLHKQAIGSTSVLKPRYFALFSISNADFSLYKASVVYELKFAIVNNTPTITTVGNPKTVGKNAMAIVPFYAGGNKRSLKLTVPCIGGKQQPGGQAGSCLKLINASAATGMGTVSNTFPKPAGLDFRSVAYATDGTAYILCGAFMTDFNRFQWKLYKTTTGNIVPGGSLPTTAVHTETNFHSYFWALGMCKPTGSANEYLIFARGGKTSSETGPSKDQIVCLKKGDPWTSAQTFNAPALALIGDNFAINSIDISVDGRVARLRSAAMPASVRAAVIEEVRKATAEKKKEEK